MNTPLRELARARRLELTDSDLERLEPMVSDLLDVAARLRELAGAALAEAEESQ